MLRGHRLRVRSAQFSPDGKTVVTAAQDATARLYFTHLEDLIPIAQARVGRELTCEEREQYLNEQNVCPTPTPTPIPTSIAEGIAAATAIESFNQADQAAQKGDQQTASRLFTQAVQSAIQAADAKVNDTICWYGSIDGFAAIVMPACERAVALAPDEKGYADSRGLARALTGDTKGAIADFKAAVEAYKESTEYVKKRQQWIATLEAGGNPFDAATLKSLR